MPYSSATAPVSENTVNTVNTRARQRGTTVIYIHWHRTDPDAGMPIDTVDYR